MSMEQNDFELTSNKQNSLAPDGTGTKYPTVNAVNAVLNSKLTPYTHVSTANFNPADNTYVVFGLETVGHTIGTNFTPSNARGMAFNKTGTITACIISVYVTNSGTATGELVDFRLFNHTTNTGYSIGTFALNVSVTQTKLFTGLNIPTVIGEMASSVYLTPNWATNPTGVYMVVNYMIQ